MCSILLFLFSLDNTGSSNTPDVDVLMNAIVTTVMADTDSVVRLTVTRAVCLCRWVCVHYGHQKASHVSRRTGKRPAQQTFATNCTAGVYVAYSKERKVCLST